ncbi:hypothetical protein [Lactococcus termiticola]|uniref:DUF4064 domain-containing protein n=1 Tax=Lactococcus termiticola TaxID=2169526 RepID=A0A2R5HG85_9LACT|nr:hypothetical protein [Lactococcus termiticola]GBG96866.1 hypothetical protein NtB2_00991 [Lactococcus termiticola]
MESAKKLALIGNILQTIWFVLMIIGMFVTGILKALDAIPAAAGGHNHLGIIGLIVVLILSWIAGSRLENNTWRWILLILAIVALIYAGSLIAAILFIIAFFKAGKKA